MNKDESPKLESLQKMNLTRWTDGERESHLVPQMTLNLTVKKRQRKLDY
jgi:hypothetical protein